MRLVHHQQAWLLVALHTVMLFKVSVVSFVTSSVPSLLRLAPCLNTCK